MALDQSKYISIDLGPSSPALPRAGKKRPPVKDRQSGKSCLLLSSFILVFVRICHKPSPYTLAHPQINIVSEHFIHSGTWKFIFWAVLIAIALGGWFMTNPNKHENKAAEE